MTLIDDDQVEKFFRIFFIKPRTVLVLSNCLINREVHLTAFVDLAVLDFPASIAKRSKHFVFGIVDQNISIGQIKNFRAAVFAGAVPAHVPELPADLKSDGSLAGAAVDSRQSVQRRAVGYS
jgi:hypothetical protein